MNIQYIVKELNLYSIKPMDSKSIVFTKFHQPCKEKLKLTKYNNQIFVLSNNGKLIYELDRKKNKFKHRRQNKLKHLDKDLKNSVPKKIS